MATFTGINDTLLGIAEESRRKSFGLCYDFKGVGEEWITVKPNGEEEKGTPIKLQDGKISGGAGGKFNGKTLGEAFGARKSGATPKATKAPPKPAKKKQVSAILSQKRKISPVAKKKSNSGGVNANYLQMKADLSAKVLNHKPLGLKFFPIRVHTFNKEPSLAIDGSPKIIKNSLEKNLSNGVSSFSFFRPGDKRSDGSLAITAFYQKTKEVSIPPIETLAGGSLLVGGQKIVYSRKFASLFHEIGHAVLPWWRRSP